MSALTARPCGPLVALAGMAIESGTSGPAAALSVLLLLLMTPVIGLYWHIGRRRVAGIRT